MITRLAGAAARRPGVTGAVLVALGVWITAVALAYTTGLLAPMVRQVAAQLAGMLA